MKKGEKSMKKIYSPAPMFSDAAKKIHYSIYCRLNLG